MGKRGRAQGAYGQGPARTLVREARFVGTLQEWSGAFGWILPEEPVNHPEVDKQQGMVFLDQKDVVEDLPGLGAAVSFLVYSDNTCVGACDCRVAQDFEQEDQGVAYAGSAYRGGSAKRPAGTAGLAASRKGAGKGYAPPVRQQSPAVPEPPPMEGHVKSWKGESGYIKPCQPLDQFFGPGWGGDLFFSVDDVVAEIQGIGAPVSFVPYLGPRGPSAANVGPAAEPEKQDHSAVLDQVHSALSEGVWAAVQVAGQVEESWSPQELSKRLVRYLYKGAQSPDLLELPWDEAVNRYLDRAMQSYNSACGDRPWFLELDLSQALGAAAWALAQSTAVRPRPQRAQVMQLAGRGFTDRLHRTRLDKALWGVLEASFEAEENVLSKMFGFLARSYDAALKSVSYDTRPVRGLQQAERFMKQWIDDSMTRTWTSLPEPENVITEDSVTWLFENLLHPFGEDDPYSCVPRRLLGGKQRLPKNWNFIRPMVEELFVRWGQPSEPSKRRKRQQRLDEGEAAGLEEATAEGQDEAAAEADGLVEADALGAGDLEV